MHQDDFFRDFQLKPDETPEEAQAQDLGSDPQEAVGSSEPSSASQSTPIPPTSNVPPPPHEHSEQADQFHPSGNPQIIFSWKAPLRPFVKRSQKIIRFYIAVALLLSLIILFFGDWILMIPIWTVLFLFYVLTITPPPEVEHRITQFGIDTTGTKLRWEVLSHFHFDKRFGYDILTVVTQPPYFDHFYMVVPTDEIKKRLMVILSAHIVYEDEPKKTFVDRMVGWFSKLVPQEDEAVVSSK